MCNPLHISQILLNLISNSFHEISKLDNPWIKITTYSDDEFCYLYVIDSGHGISSDVRAKMFDPFFTTKGINEGTGLGLSLSKTMATKSGGDLIYDDSSRHTCFILKVPLAKAGQTLGNKAS